MSKPGGEQKLTEDGLTVQQVREDIGYFRDERKREYDLLGQRMTWLVTCQSFLLTGYAISYSNYPGPEDWFARSLLPALGFILSVLAFPAILGAMLTIGAWKQKQVDLVGKYSELPELQRYMIWRDHPSRHGDVWYRLSSVFSVAVPPVFAAVWLCLYIKGSSDPWARPKAPSQASYSTTKKL